MKPPFKYSGGKSKEIKRILPLLPKEFNRVIEPFAGSAALSFYLNKPSILSDIRENNINTFQIIRDEPKKLLDYLDKIKQITDTKELERIYYLHRDEYYNSTDPFIKAVRWIVLRQICFSGMDRINSNTGKFNVPFGWYKVFNHNITIEHSQFLNNCKLIHGDWKLSVDDITENDFIFFDPPYYKRNSEYGNGYNSNDEQLHKDISSFFNKSIAKCMIVHVDCDLYRDLYRDCNIIENPFMYSQNFKSRDNSKQKVTHLYITNYGS